MLFGSVLLADLAFGANEATGALERASKELASAIGVDWAFNDAAKTN
jgi:hypothetical protein